MTAASAFVPYYSGGFTAHEATHLVEVLPRVLQLSKFLNEYPAAHNSRLRAVSNSRSVPTTLEMNKYEGKTTQSMLRCPILELEPGGDYWRVMSLPNVSPRTKELRGSHKKKKNN